MPGAACQREPGQLVWAAIGLYCLDLECRADIRSRERDEITVRRPHRIDRILLDQRRRRATVERNIEQTRDAADDGSHGNGLTVRRPGRSTLELERLPHDSSVRAVGVRDVQQRLSV